LHLLINNYPITLSLWTRFSRTQTDQTWWGEIICHESTQ